MLIVELKQHLVLTELGTMSIGGTVNNSKADPPFINVTTAMNNRKLPSLSAKIPDNGGPKISATGIALLTIDASSILNPKERICKARYGYKTTKLAD